MAVVLFNGKIYHVSPGKYRSGVRWSSFFFHSPWWTSTRNLSDLSRQISWT